MGALKGRPYGCFLGEGGEARRVAGSAKEKTPARCRRYQVASDEGLIGWGGAVIISAANSMGGMEIAQVPYSEGLKEIFKK
jgi:hypothetical protein